MVEGSGEGLQGGMVAPAGRPLATLQRGKVRKLWTPERWERPW